MELLGFGRIRVRGLQPASWKMRRPLWSSVTTGTMCLIALFASEVLFGFEDWNWGMGDSFYVLSCDGLLILWPAKPSQRGQNLRAWLQ